MTKKEFDTPERVIDEIRAIYADPDPDLSTRLVRELIVHALKCHRDDLEVLDMKVLSRAMAEFRYASRVFKPYRDRRKVSIFGSARTPEKDPYYQMAVSFANLLAQKEFMVITGAAEGIMKAGIQGAGADASFGVNILLPFEQAANTIIGDDPKLITFKYFFTRKLFFLMESSAVALFPGGFGTHDEGFETLTLLQTGKAPPMPFLLMELPGETYWESFDRFVREELLGRKLISEVDLMLYRIVHSAEEGVDYITRFYSVYHSTRQVRDRLVVRLESELSGTAIQTLAREFPDLLKKGTIEKSGPLAEEAQVVGEVADQVDAEGVGGGGGRRREGREQRGPRAEQRELQHQHADGEVHPARREPVLRPDDARVEQRQDADLGGEREPEAQVLPEQEPPPRDRLRRERVDRLLLDLLPHEPDAEEHGDDPAHQRDPAERDAADHLRLVADGDLLHGQREQQQQGREEEDRVQDLVAHGLAEGVRGDGEDLAHASTPRRFVFTGFARSTSSRSTCSSVRWAGTTLTTRPPASRTASRKASTKLGSRRCERRAPGS